MMAQTREQKRASSRKHYEANKAAMKKRAKEYTKRNRLRLADYVRDVKAATGCADCPETDSIVLTFDHVRGEKVDCIATMVNRSVSLKRLEDEIAKCEVVCANCHARRTYRRRVEKLGISLGP